MNQINIHTIVVKQRARALDQDHIDSLKDSIRDEGLLQPIVVRITPEETRLVAGEHRLEAFRQLHKESRDPRFEEIPVTSLEESLVAQGVIADGESLTEGDLLRYEIEENVKRLQMNWQDRVISVARYHKLSEQSATKRGEKWSQKQTGDLMGINQSNISRVLLVAKRLNSSREDDLWKCESLTLALHSLVKEKKDEVTREQLKRMRARKEAVQNKASSKGREELDKLKVKAASVDDEDTPKAPGPVEGVEGVELYTKDDLYELYYHGDALEVLPTIAGLQTIHHIITDPPYGIDMDNLNQKNIDSVRNTHEVAPNVSLLLSLLKVGYDVIDEKGFMCFWYDLDHHNLLQTEAAKIGWKVCRWPFVWAKSSRCANQAAAYNFTKATEVCMILRKSGDATLVNKQPDNFIVAPSLNSTAHPFHKPVSVWQRLIHAVSREGQTIVDPFAGSGSMLGAGLQMNRDVLGVEIDEPHILTGVDYLHGVLNSSTSFLDDVI